MYSFLSCKNPGYHSFYFAYAVVAEFFVITYGNFANTFSAWIFEQLNVLKGADCLLVQTRNLVYGRMAGKFAIDYVGVTADSARWSKV